MCLSLVLAGTGGAVAAQSAPFVESAAASGLDFEHFSGASGELYLPEMMGPGAAWFDLENDGDLDLYVVQGQPLGGADAFAKALRPPRHPLPLTDRVYRNELVSATAGTSLAFRDVTVDAGLQPGGYPMGVASGDFDNDGLTDLYVFGLDSNRLLSNRGDGVLVDVTEESGADDPRWSVGATFLDYDRDGWLDLWIVNYLDFSIAARKRCVGPTGTADYCDPTAYEPAGDRLLRNRGDGSFEDVTAASGVGVDPGAGLAVATGDFNGDGWIDVYVANDGMANHLFLNSQDGTFVEASLLAGVAVNAEGEKEASMGLAVGDVDEDGDEDIFVTHLFRETNTLYVNDGRASFDDRTEGLGLGTPSWTNTAFGTGFLDYDNDGRLDLVAVNGAVTYFATGSRRGLEEPNQLFRNDGDRFTEVSSEAGAAWKESRVSRGAAFGDVDNDGDTDVLVLNNDAPLTLLLNQVGSLARWIGLRLVDPSGRDALGARVQLKADGATVSQRVVRTSGSYASASDPRLLFGLCEAVSGESELSAHVAWPDGRVEEFGPLPVGRYSELRQGTGRPAGGAH